MDYSTTMREIYDEARTAAAHGKVATTIPELASVDASKFGIHLVTTSGEDHAVGDSGEKFSIQSISKVFSLALAVTFLGEKIWERVGVEPSGSAFNSLVQLEYENGKPRNPFINAGALVVCDMLVTHLRDPKRELLDFVRTVSRCAGIESVASVALSEKNTGFRNAALANLLKSFGNMENDVQEVLDLYFFQCSIAMTCRELAHAFLMFAGADAKPAADARPAADGRPASDQAADQFAHGGSRILTASQVKRLNALMQTCGLYDESGEYSYKVGLPGKSGIGGGIAAVNPHHYCVAAWSPGLNEKGNSVRALRALELLTTKTGESIF